MGKKKKQLRGFFTSVANPTPLKGRQLPKRRDFQRQQENKSAICGGVNSLKDDGKKTTAEGLLHIRSQPDAIKRAPTPKETGFSAPTGKQKRHLWGGQLPKRRWEKKKTAEGLLHIRSQPDAIKRAPTPKETGFSAPTGKQKRHLWGGQLPKRRWEKKSS